MKLSFRQAVDSSSAGTHLALHATQTSTWHGSGEPQIPNAWLPAAGRRRQKNKNKNIQKSYASLVVLVAVWERVESNVVLDQFGPVWSSASEREMVSGC